jgi:hypothetical protein
MTKLHGKIASDSKPETKFASRQIVFIVLLLVILGAIVAYLFGT